QASPSVIGNMPVSILITVVFPLPFGPRNPKTSPFSTVIEALFTAVKLPKRRVRFFVCMAGITVSPRRTAHLRLRRRAAGCHGFPRAASLRSPGEHALLWSAHCAAEILIAAGSAQHVHGRFGWDKCPRESGRSVQSAHCQFSFPARKP